VATKYLIRAGERFVQPDGKVLTGGDTIELPADLAAMHATRIQPLPPEMVPDEKPQE
jgi:hypothetical protein